MFDTERWQYLLETSSKEVASIKMSSDFIVSLASDELELKTAIKQWFSYGMSSGQSGDKLLILFYICNDAMQKPKRINGCMAIVSPTTSLPISRVWEKYLEPMSSELLKKKAPHVTEKWKSLVKVWKDRKTVPLRCISSLEKLMKSSHRSSSSNHLSSQRPDLERRLSTSSSKADTPRPGTGTPSSIKWEEDIFADMPLAQDSKLTAAMDDSSVAFNMAYSDLGFSQTSMTRLKSGMQNFTQSDNMKGGKDEIMNEINTSNIQKMTEEEILAELATFENDEEEEMTRIDWKIFNGYLYKLDAKSSLAEVSKYRGLIQVAGEKKRSHLKMLGSLSTDTDSINAANRLVDVRIDEEKMVALSKMTNIAHDLKAKEKKKPKARKEQVSQPDQSLDDMVNQEMERSYHTGDKRQNSYQEPEPFYPDDFTTSPGQSQNFQPLHLDPSQHKARKTDYSDNRGGGSARGYDNRPKDSATSTYTPHERSSRSFGGNSARENNKYGPSGNAPPAIKNKKNLTPKRNTSDRRHSGGGGGGDNKYGPPVISFDIDDIDSDLYYE